MRKPLSTILYLRFDTYHKKKSSLDLEKFPPKSNACRSHILQAHFQAYIFKVSCTHQKIYGNCSWDVRARKWRWWTGSNNYWRGYTSWKAYNALQLQKMQVRQNVFLSQKRFTMFRVFKCRKACSNERT